MNTKEKFEQVAMELEGFHSIFYRIWQIGMPTITDKIETAAVGFDNGGNYILFMFNQAFMDKLSLKELCFVVAHECMHLILNHGKRLRGLIPEVGNVAADVVINEELINRFGFSPDLPVIKDLPACTIETVFGKRGMTVQNWREFEYYYRQLVEDMEKKGQIKYVGIGKLIDNHDSLGDIGEIPENIKQDIVDAMKNMSKEELEELNKLGVEQGESKDTGKETEESTKNAGSGSFFTWVKTLLKPKLVRKWESFIKEWTIARYHDKYRTQWKTVNRRYSIVSSNTSLLIPSDNEIDDKSERMIDLVFYMDVSGSCHSVSKKFFAAAKSIPTDKFIIDAYAFDTELVKLDIKSDNMPYGGGTSFHQLEANLAKRKRYPSAVFVLTDGYGTDVKPKYPERWHVFLTPDNSKRNFLGKVNFHMFEEVYV